MKNKSASATQRDIFGYHSSFEFCVGKDGNPVKRTKSEHPWTYDDFVTWRGGENSLIDDGVYSDRLLQWDHDKCRSLMRKHFGNESDYYTNRSPKQIEAFLSELLGRSIKLILIMECCNQSSGHPLWRFEFKYNN